MSTQPYTIRTRHPLFLQRARAKPSGLPFLPTRLVQSYIIDSSRLISETSRRLCLRSQGKAHGRVG
jgi:hypothetical protein